MLVQNTFFSFYRFSFFFTILIWSGKFYSSIHIPVLFACIISCRQTSHTTITIICANSNIDHLLCYRWSRIMLLTSNKHKLIWKKKNVLNIYFTNDISALEHIQRENKKWFLDYRCFFSPFKFLQTLESKPPGIEIFLIKLG